MGSKIVIVGAGWRVSTFIVPALYALGMKPTDLYIVRKSPTKLEGILSGIPMTTKLSNVSGDVEITLNCVPRALLASMQKKLIEQFPKAIHFCDTPVAYRISDFLRARWMRNTPILFSLEDWPFLPNLIPFFELAGTGSGQFHWRFEHVGVATHFFSISRGVLGTKGQKELGIITRTGQYLYHRRRKNGSACILQGPRDKSTAKISFWDGTRLLEDFFELFAQPNVGSVERSDELLWREADDDRVSYFVGHKCFCEVAMPSTISRPFIERGSRNGIHELDKVVALISILGSAIKGRPNAYPFYHSVQDSFLDRLSRKAGIAYTSGA